MTPKALRASLAVAITVLMPTACAEHRTHAPDDNRVVSSTVFDQPTNIPGKSLVAATFRFPPGAKMTAHHHAPSAFIMVYVISGEIRSQVGDDPVRVYHTGETWSEAPGSYHKIAENASAGEPAELLAVLLLDTTHGPLTINDGGVPGAG